MKNKKRIVSVLLAVLIVILLALLGGILYQLQICLDRRGQND